MKMIVRLLVLSVLLFLGLTDARAQGTAFTYQGRLSDNGDAPTGTYDLRFAIYSALSGGSTIAGPVTNSATGVTNGLFLSTLDFGASPFNGSARWIEIAVRTNGSGAFAVLAPRQFLASTPYAVRAANFSGAVTTGQLPASVARLDVAQNFTAPMTFINATGNFSGSLNGSGAGVTNVRWTSINGEGSLGFVSGSAFLPGSPPLVGASPRGLAAGDVNGDGWLDLISANSSGSTLSVLTNNRSGGFTIASSPAVGSGPRSVVAADLNADGRIDLVSANYNGSSLSVLTNSGSGGMVSASTNTVGANPQSVAVADVNGDGKPDLISANLNANTLSILTNKGGGTFVLASSPAVGTSPIFVITADLNGDGRPDLISANTGPNTLSVLTNNGSGGFVPASTNAVGGSPYSIAVTDVNGDGRPDLISANQGSGNLSILTNNGGTVFVIASSPIVGNSPVSVTAADVNGDGRPDLISANSIDSNLSVLTNNGAGNFILATLPPTGPAPYVVVAADVNRDGTLDLISANQNGNNLTVLFNTPAPRFTTFLSVAGNITSGGLFIGDGASLTNLNASHLSSGTVPDARLSNNVARLNPANQTFTGTNTFTRVGIGTGTPSESLQVIGNILASGTVTGSSDRNIKQDFAAVDSRAVLEKVAALPITTWSYQADAGVRHLGPMAQDFSAAFAVGPDNTHISMVDADGVALAAIQGLNHKLEEERKANRTKDSRIATLEKELGELKELVRKISQPRD